MGPSETFYVKTPDGVELLIRDWGLPAGIPRRGAALIIHGLGEHSARYDHVSAAITALGLHVRSYDQRGFGRSGGRKGVIPDKTSLVCDAQTIYAALATHAAQQGDPRPPFLVGHSMGGAVAAHAVTGGWIAPCGLVLSSPAIDPRLPPFMGLLLPILALIAPNAGFSHGIQPESLTQDRDVIEAMKHDSLMHDHVTPRLVMSMLEAGEQALAGAATLSVPTLVLIAGKDKVVKSDKADQFAQKIAEPLRTTHHYPELFHEVFNEREPDRARVLQDLQDWLKSKI